MILIIILSFLLDNTISLFINQSSIFFPMFTLISLIIIFSYKLKEYRFFILSSVIGLIYDAIFTDTLFLNASLFLISSLGIYIIFKKINYNLFNVVLVSLLLIIFYRIITYFLFILSFSLSFDILALLKGIYSSLIINVLYIILLYFIRNKEIKSSK